MRDLVDCCPEVESDCGEGKPKAEARGCESNVGLNDLLARVASHMRMKYRVGMDEIEITDTPGYWRDKEEKMHPGHPLHGCIGCNGPFRATYTYFDPPREKGRFASPTRTWAALRANGV